VVTEWVFVDEERRPIHPRLALVVVQMNLSLGSCAPRGFSDIIVPCEYSRVLQAVAYRFFS